MVSSKDMSIAASSAIQSVNLPEGNYKLIGWQIDATGRRLIDEICQIGAYTPTTTFAQYVMPHGELSPFAQRRFNLRVITVSRYRMLKDLKTNRFLKTKSEISSLVDFTNWLEANKGYSTDGIILVYHEVKKMAPLMLLDALKRYGLYDRFSAVVKGFCNTHPLAETKCAATVKTFSLKVLSKILLHKEEEFGTAVDRAKACYNIVLHLGQSDRNKIPVDRVIDECIMERYAAEFTRQYARTIETEENDLMDLKNFIERQNTFRPVLKEIMKFDWMSRQSVSRMRRKLVEHNLDFNHLKTAWNKGGREALQLLLKKVSTASQQELVDMLTIFDCYFDPAKDPVAGNYYRLRRQRALSNRLFKDERDVCSGSRSGSGSGTGSTNSAQSDTSASSVKE